MAQRKLCLLICCPEYVHLAGTEITYLHFRDEKLRPGLCTYLWGNSRI